jgi:hypothetical protein
MKKIDFINYISLFKEIKIKIEKFCNKIYTEFIEKNTIKNNDVKIKFENIKDTFLNEIKTNIDKLININNYDGNDIQKNYKEVKKNEIQNEIKQIKNNNDNKNTKQIDEQLKLKILQEIKNNLSNNNKLEFHPPEIELNHLSYSKDLNEGLMEDESNNSEEENFDFLRFDKEVYINELKGQIFDDIEDNKDEMKLQTSSSVVQNTYGYTTPIKMENQKGKKYINIYYNNNFDFNKLNSHNKKISSDMYIKSTKNRKLKNNFYDNSHEQNINGKKIEEMEIEIPYLNNKKNNSLTSLYENKLNDSGNKDNKINKRMLTKNKEDDYSNVATSENSGNYTKNNFRQNYKKNFIISYNNKNGQQIDNKYNQQQYIESRYDNSDKKYIYENKPIPKTSQKKYPKNFNKWSSIKKFYKLKEGGTSLNDYFCPNTETKPFYTKKIYK